MPPKTMPTTVRFTESEQTFLANLKIPGATSISEKVRAIIADRKRLESAGRDYSAALSMANTLLGSLADNVRALENRHHMHSQLVRRLIEFAPELLATLIADGVGPDATGEDLNDLEESLAVQLARIIDIALQVYIARDSSLYDPTHFGPKRLAPLQRLCRLTEEESGHRK